MGRKKESESSTKNKILDAAQTIFMEKGYEETTVRMIVDKAGAVVGSFYHHFGSKEELFEDLVEQFLQGYTEKVFAIAYDDSKTFMERLYLLLEEMERNTRLYFSRLQADKLHWTIPYSLHYKTLQSILPGIQYMIEDALKNGTAKNRLNMDPTTLAAVVLQGIEGIIHAKPLGAADTDQIGQIKKNVVDYVVLILAVDD